MDAVTKFILLTAYVEECIWIMLAGSRCYFTSLDIFTQLPKDEVKSELKFPVKKHFEHFLLSFKRYEGLFQKILETFPETLNTTMFLLDLQTKPFTQVHFNIF